MGIAQILALLVTIINNKELWEAVKKIIEFLKTLTPEKQEAFATFVNSMSEVEQSAYFNSLLPPDKQEAMGVECPNCPDDCKDVEAGLQAVLAA